MWLCPNLCADHKNPEGCCDLVRFSSSRGEARGAQPVGVMNHGASVLPLPLLPALCSHLQPNCGAQCHTPCLCLLCSFPCWFESRCHCPGLPSRVDRHVPCPTAEQQHCSLYGISFCWVSAVLAAREQGWDLLIQGTRSPAVLMILMCKGEDRRSGTVLRVMLPALPGGCKMSHCPSA